MAQAANIVLADAQASPVNHTFIPLGPGTNNEIWFEDQTGTSPLGYNRISISVKRGAPGLPGQNQGEKTARITLKVFVPALETMGTNDAGIVPPAKMAYQLTSQHMFMLSERSAKLERQNVRKFSYGLLANAQVVSAIEDLIGIW